MSLEQKPHSKAQIALALIGKESEILITLCRPAGCDFPCEVPASKTKETRLKCTAPRMNASRVFNAMRIGSGCASARINGQEGTLYNNGIFRGR